MIVGILILAICIILGILTGLQITIPYSYSQYVAVAILACLDTVLGALIASTAKKFRMRTFLSGFFGNALIAIFFVYLSYRLNVDIYLAAIIVFGSRLMDNFASLRRDAVDNLDKKGKTITWKRKKKKEEIMQKLEDLPKEE